MRKRLTHSLTLFSSILALLLIIAWPLSLLLGSLSLPRTNPHRATNPATTYAYPPTDADQNPRHQRHTRLHHIRPHHQHSSFRPGPTSFFLPMLPHHLASRPPTPKSRRSFLGFRFAAGHWGFISMGIFTWTFYRLPHHPLLRTHPHRTPPSCISPLPLHPILPHPTRPLPHLQLRPPHTTPPTPSAPNAALPS